MAEAVEVLGKMGETADGATRLLTICIPTHNRREVLEECLKSVLPQAGALGVGVCVSDNCSTDGTWQALESLKLQYPWMQIMRHTRNIGYRDNLTGAVLSSHVQYVWPIGDKYVLLPGALEFVVAQLVRLHPDAVIVNSPGVVVSTVERTYSVPQSCLTELGWWTTLCGATVLPRQAWLTHFTYGPLAEIFRRWSPFSPIWPRCRPLRCCFPVEFSFKVGRAVVRTMRRVPGFTARWRLGVAIGMMQS